MKGRDWSAHDEAVLRDGYPRVPYLKLLAQQLGRSVVAVKSRAQQLGLRRPGRHYFTADEKARVRALHATHTAKQIAAEVFGGAVSVNKIYGLIERLGLPRKWPEYSQAVKDQVRELHGQGLLDSEIAPKVGIDRRSVTYIRNQLGLPVNQEALHRAQLRAVASQAKTLGIRHGGDLRRLAFAKYAERNGWPAAVPPRGVQILNTLAARGPMTRDQLHLAIGMNPKRLGKHACSAAGPNRPIIGGSYTADLLHRGLIVRLKRYTTGRGHGHNRLHDLYMLSETACALVEARNGQTRDSRHETREGERCA